MLGDELSSFGGNDESQPCHVVVCVNDRSEMLIGVDDTGLLIDCMLCDKCRVAFEASNLEKGGGQKDTAAKETRNIHVCDALDLFHLAIVFESFFDGVVEEEIGCSRFDPMVREFTGGENLLEFVEDAVGSHAPSLR